MAYYPNESLNPPFAFCGYNGADYWQALSHLHMCPWRGVGSIADREKRFRDVLRDLYEIRSKHIIATGVKFITDTSFGHALEEMCPNCVTPWKCNGPHLL